MTDALVQRAAQVRSAQELAQLLRELRRRYARHRRESEPSYRELAARTGWSHAAIAEYMSGRTLPPTDRLDGLARLLGANAAELGAIATARDRVADSRRGGRATGPGEKAGAVPRQLPAVPPHFVGRAAELVALSDLAGRPPEAGTVVISAVAGMAGIGKTALAVHAGHRLAGRFPDGQVFVDLHGFTAGMEPLAPAQALDRLLRDVGVPGERIPSGVEERAALWRSVLAGRRMLIVLDNAATEDQVRPLLPGAAGCLVLVTSRRRLIGLDTTHAVSLDTLAQTDAIQLFLSTAARPELTSDLPEVLEAVRVCGWLPLAIRVAAARLKHRRVWTVADLLGRLRDLTLDDSVHGTLQLSYQHLSADAQRLYRLLVLHPGPDVEPYAAAALIGGGLDEARRLLDRLVDDHMLQEPSPGRFHFHDLVRAHAVDIATKLETEQETAAAVTRLLDHYRHAAASATAVAYPHQRQRRRTVPPAGTPIPGLDDQNQAKSWLDAELANLLAATRHAARRGWPEHTCDLSVTIGEHLRTRSRYREMEELHQHALDLARHHGDHLAEIDALNGLGVSNRMMARRDQAGEYFGQALRIAHEIGDRDGELRALIGLGHIHRMVGRHQQAADHFGQTLRIAREIGDRACELQTLAGLAQTYRLLGREEQAADYFAQTLRIAQEIGDPLGEQQGLTGLGHAYRMLGRYEQSSDCLRQALRIAQDTGDPTGELQALNVLGSVHRMLGQYEDAADYIWRALRIAQEIGGRNDELYALNSLGDAHLRLGQHDKAAAIYQEALDLARELDDQNWQFEALQGMGRLCHATGQPELALIHHRQALALATGLAQPTDQARAHDGLGHAYDALKQHDQARQHWQQALEILTRIGIDRTDDLETNVADIRARLLG